MTTKPETNANPTTMRQPKFTVEVYDRHSIAWAKDHPELLSRRQRNSSKVRPLSHGANPKFIFANRRSMADARRDASPYLSSHLVLINGEAAAS